MSPFRFRIAAAALLAASLGVALTGCQSADETSTGSTPSATGGTSAGTSATGGLSTPAEAPSTTSAGTPATAPTAPIPEADMRKMKSGE